MGHQEHRQSNTHHPQFTVLRHAFAALLYAAFAIYLYRPYFGGLTGWRWLLPVNASLAALGGYTLSRRWIAGFTGSFLAGLVYGFGPFFLGLAKFHPTAGLLAACVPWLFLPAVLIERRYSRWVGTPLLLLPFAVILAFFYLAAGHRLFAAPLQAEIRPADLAGFIAPLALAGRRTVVLGLYHVPVAVLILGLAMMWTARRYGVFILLLVGFLLAFCRLFLDPGKVAWIGVSPILWLSIPMAWCAVLSGIGLQGLIEAGTADRQWILAATIALGVLAICALLLAAKSFQAFLGLADGYGRLFVQAAQIYLLGVVATAIIFLMARQSLRLHWLRWAILAAALGLDILLGARFLVDQIH